MKGYVTVFKSKFFKLAVLLGLFLASTVIIASVLMGEEAGSFVIQVKNSDPSASISVTEIDMDALKLEGKNPESSDLASMLAPEGVTSFTDYTPRRFLENDYQTLKEYTTHMGRYLPVGDDKSGYNLYCYTFFIVNTGSSAVNVKISMDYSKAVNHFDEIARVLTFSTRRISGENQVNIYQKKDEIIKDYSQVGYTVAPKSFAVESNNSGVVYNNENILLYAPEARADGTKEYDFAKYSVFFWIEGEDPDSDKYGEQLYSGSIKYSMSIDVSND